MIKIDGPITARELSKRLLQDPEYIEQHRQQQNLRAKKTEYYRNEQSILRRELLAAGFEIDDLSDLINKPIEYSSAIPILLRHLQMPYSDATRETIARALAIKEVRPHWATLAAEYIKEPDQGRQVGAKVGLALALAVATTDNVIEDLVAIAKDRSHGQSRLFFLKPLMKSKKPVAKEAIEELRGDPDLSKNFDSWLRRR